MKHVLAAMVLMATACSHGEAAFEADSHSPWECALSSPLLPVLEGLLPGTNPALTFEGAEIAARRAFGLDELTIRSLGVGKTYHGCTFSVSGSLLGEDLYRESSICIGLAHSYSERLKLGTRFKLLWLSVRGFASELSPEIDLGVQAVPLPQFTAGASVNNLLGSMKDSAGPTSSIGLSLGALRSKVVASATQNRGGTRTGLGGMVEVGSRMEILVGISSHPNQLSAGLEVSLATLIVAIAVEWHSELGLSESIGIRFIPGMSPSKRGE
jgi:hypothetical protein